MKKNKPWYILRQGSFKDVTEFIFCWPPTAGHDLLLRVVGFPSEAPMERGGFSFAHSCHLELATGLEIEACVYFPFQV